MVAPRAQEGLDVSRSALVVSRLPRAAYECAPAASHRSPGSRACRHHQACRRSYAAAQLCHPSLGANDRYSDQPARRSAEDARLARGRCHGRRSRVADIFRHRGPAWRASHAGHVSLDQLKVMSAIERCRTAALGGHIERCEACAHLRISYNSCRNRHCPKCQAVAAKEWLVDRQADLLPVPYFHVVFTLPRPLADIAYHNKAVVYDLLLKVAAETLITIAADPKHLGARIGLTAVLHTWGSPLTHHPHAHIIVPGGGLSPDGQHWIVC